jgi:valyl-tRNA synthetase
VQIQQGAANPNQEAGMATQRATRRTLIRTLETILRLAHPITPFITEELWQKVAPVAGRAGPSISIAPYPVSQPERIDAQAVAEMNQLKQWVDACRNLRGEMNVSPSTRLPLFALVAPQDQDFLNRWASVLQALSKLSEVQIFQDESAWTQAAQAAPVAVVGATRLCLFMKVDIEAEKLRLGKEATRLQTEITKAQHKLGNEAFVAKAPPAVIEQEQKRLSDFSNTLAKIQEQLAQLDQMAKT